MRQIPTPDVPVEWSPPKFVVVDPPKDAMAKLLSIRSGTMTLAEVIATQARNPDAVLTEIAATNAKIDAQGPVVESDPRRVTKPGNAPLTSRSFIHQRHLRRSIENVAPLTLGWGRAPCQHLTY